MAATKSGMKVTFDLIMQRNDRSSSLDRSPSFLYCLDFIWVWFYPILVDFKSPERDFWLTKDAFAGVDCWSCFFKRCNDCF